MCGKLLNLQCQTCGNTLTIEEEDLKKFMFCSACGSKYVYEEDKAVIAGHSEDELLRRGIQHLERKNYEYALNEFEEMTRFFPNNYRGWIGALICNGYFHKTRIKGCKENIEATAPENVRAMMGSYIVRDMDFEEEEQQNLQGKEAERARIQKELSDYKEKGHGITNMSIMSVFKGRYDSERSKALMSLQKSNEDLQRHEKLLKQTKKRLWKKEIKGFFIGTIGILIAIVGLIDVIMNMYVPKVDLPLIVGGFGFCLTTWLFFALKIKFGSDAKYMLQLKGWIASTEESIERCNKRLEDLKEKYSPEKLKTQQEAAVAEETEEYNTSISGIEQEISEIQGNIATSKSNKTIDEYLQILKSLA